MKNFKIFSLRKCGLSYEIRVGIRKFWSGLWGRENMQLMCSVLVIFIFVVISIK